MLTALTGLLTRFRYATPAPVQAMTREAAFLEIERIEADAAASQDLFTARSAADKALADAKGKVADAAVEQALAHRRCAEFGDAIYRRREAVDRVLRETVDPRISESIAALEAARNRLSGQFINSEAWINTGFLHGPTRTLQGVCLNGRQIEARAAEITEAIGHCRELYASDLSGDELESHLVGVVGDLLEPVAR